MAKQANGFLGGFSGKLGPAVGYKWKGIWCLRARPRNVFNPRTEAQQEHRTMFKEEVRLAGKMRWAVNIGLKAMSDDFNMTAQNLFVKANQQCFSLAPATQPTLDGGTTARLQVDYPTLCISAGPVAPVAVTSVEVDDHNVLNVSFEKNPMHAAARAYDNVFVWVWCPEAEEGYLASPVYRRTGHVSTLLPSEMEGLEVHVYAFVQDEHGRCSATAYGHEDDSSLNLNGELNELSEAGAEQSMANHPKADADQTKANYPKAAQEGKEKKKISPI
ncbi:MAG: DUF6266 family protein [bacterium]